MNHSDLHDREHEHLGASTDVPLPRGGHRHARHRRPGLLADPASLSPRLRRRRAYTLVALTLLLPGSAQLVAGRRRWGRAGLRVWAALWVVAVLSAVTVWVRRSFVLGLFSRTWTLWVLAALLAVAAVAWALTFVDAVRLSRLSTLPRATRRGVVVAAVVGIVVTSGPLGWGASALYTGGAVLGQVFHADVSRQPVKGRLNVLLLGGDSGADRMGTRPDTIILASVDAATGKVVTFGFARDTENITFRSGSVMARLMPQGWNCGDECLLNGLYTWAGEHRDQFPSEVDDPGAWATKEAVEALSGVDIQYYALIDLQGFTTMIDAVGGLDMIVKNSTPIGGGSSPVRGYIQPGRHHFDGFHALWYARSREGSTNYDRMARQRCVLQAAMKQVDPQTVVTRFRDLAAAGEKVLHTDIPQADLGGLADLSLRGRAFPITGINFVPPLIKPWDYDPGVIRDTVSSTLAASEADPGAAVPSSAAGRVGPRPPSSTESGPAAAGGASSGAAPGGVRRPGGSGQDEGSQGGGQASSGGDRTPASTVTDGSDVCVVP